MLDDGSPYSTSSNKPGKSPRPNVPRFLNSFYKQVLETQQSVPRGQQDVMLYFGADFAFKNAPAWFEFIEKIIHYANREGVFNVMFSTPERFLAAKKAAAAAAATDASGSSASSGGGDGAGSDGGSRSSSGSGSSSNRSDGGSSGSSSGVSWPLKSDDFLPYRCANSHAWTGG
jgi:hypothetical protein